MPRANAHPRRFAQTTAELLVPQLVQFLADTGLPRRKIVSDLRALADAVEAGRDTRIARTIEYELIVRVGSVVHEWARSPDFTDADAEPRALSLRGRFGLSSLIRKYVPRFPVPKVLDCMTASGAVHRRADGRYVLVQRPVMVGSQAAICLGWMATLASQYLNTAFANWKEKNPSSRNLDRIASVFDLPEAELPRFREFTKHCTRSCIEQIDNWLEDRSVRASRGRRVEAGVHVYSFTSADTFNQRTRGGRSTRKRSVLLKSEGAPGLPKAGGGLS
jgi:hypothetical protein